jgi:hypothetical protein
MSWQLLKQPAYRRAELFVVADGAGDVPGTAEAGACGAAAVALAVLFSGQ